MVEDIYKTEKSWLENNRYYGSLDESKLTSIFYFALIWNLFEKECCGKHAVLNKHSISLANKYADQCASVIDEIWIHFRNRYVKDGQPTLIFEQFVFQPNDGQESVRSTLLNDDALIKCKIEALLRIAFRLRNNLFHGEKTVGKLYEQNDNFKYINKLLMALIDAKQGNH